MEQEKKETKILVIDVSNLIHRMYYVHKNLSNKKGEKTGAIYGFLNMILFYVEKTGIKNVVLCWDAPSETNWRINIYPEYKANRRLGTEGDYSLLESVIKKTENDLQKEKKNKKELEKKLEKLQSLKDIIFAKSKIWEITSKTGFINIYRNGFEADDMIGMFVRKFPKNVKIISCDKDLLQLVNDKNKVRVFKPMLGYGKSNNKSYDIYNEKRIKEEYDIDVKDFHKLLAITGDDTDNISGVGGYAIKKASKLLNESKNIQELSKILGAEGYNIYQRNLMLVNLHFLPKELDLIDINFGSKKTKIAQEILDELEIKKFSAKDLSKINNEEFHKYVMEKFE